MIAVLLVWCHLLTNKSIVNNDNDDDIIRINNKEKRSNTESKELNWCYNLLTFKLKQRWQHIVEESFCVFFMIKLFSNLVKVIKSRLVTV